MQVEDLLFKSSEVWLMVREGVHARLYFAAPNSTTKAKIERSVDKAMTGITPLMARKIIARKIRDPEEDILRIISLIKRATTAMNKLRQQDLPKDVIEEIENWLYRGSPSWLVNHVIQLEEACRV